VDGRKRGVGIQFLCYKIRAIPPPVVCKYHLFLKLDEEIDVNSRGSFAVEEF